MPRQQIKKEENKCNCYYCKIKEQKDELTRVLNGIQSSLKYMSNTIYNADHIMDDEF